MLSTDLLLREFTEEVKTTRRVLQCIPEEKLSWTPHPKSLSLGQLAYHVAVIPGELAMFLSELTREVPSVPFPEATSLSELLSALDRSEATATAQLSAWGEDDLMAEWKMVQGDQTIIAVPRIVMMRSILFNHWYHHRGQILVYLRLLDVPVPAVYGSSADENPF
ncbi:DinB family protein [Desmospora activa]|uniref:Putative damage-inducible protein DinB n=1 Tax=Desmospora activa DSM 45169 TaxID=1121389 RepID=A0A2T4ZCN8_9BACL|nr:DinB family protein [Desmospora activa]PTM59654.1 putative damage-inducible protein DinB [Desmospora activa DSM 45169]